MMAFVECPVVQQHLPSWSQDSVGQWRDDIFITIQMLGKSTDPLHLECPTSAKHTSIYPMIIARRKYLVHFPQGPEIARRQGQV